MRVKTILTTDDYCKREDVKELIELGFPTSFKVEKLKDISVYPEILLYEAKKFMEQNNIIIIENYIPETGLWTFMINDYEQNKALTTNNLFAKSELALSQAVHDAISLLKEKTTVKENTAFTNFFDYVRTLEPYTDKWRYAFNLTRDYEDPNEHLQEIIEKVENF